jgi:glycosyltransferase involved in cell wall biosynthesis
MEDEVSSAPYLLRFARRLHLASYGTVFVSFGLLQYLTGVLLAFLCNIFLLKSYLMGASEILVWYSGIPIMLGILLILSDIFILLPFKRIEHQIKYDPPNNTKLTVVLTAYNDEQSIAQAVRDFLSHKSVLRVLVINNNSTDNTEREAIAAGATVINELEQGYGQCVYRAFQEGLRYTDTELTLLCEGDMTFRAYDIDKFMAYIPHSDIVNGTRIVEQLRSYETQLTAFMFYGNFAVGKLLEAKHLGRGTFSDVGTTYKLCRNKALSKLLQHLDNSINLEFNAHFLDTALSRDLRILECPVSFHKRVGLSKGGNVDDIRALKVGLRMIIGILFGWRLIRS